MSTSTPSTNEPRDTEARAALLSAVAEPLRSDYAALGEQIDALGAQIEALSSRRRALMKQREQILALSAEEASSDHAVAALRHGSMAGHRRFRDLVAGLHPQIFEPIDYVPVVDGEVRYGTPPYLGLHLTLTDSSRKPLREVDCASLAAAMVEFADRFVTSTPDVGDRPGMVYADILTDARDDERLHVFYTPDGSRAALAIDHWNHSEDLAEGPLADILTAAVNRAIAALERVRWDDELDGGY